MSIWAKNRYNLRQYLLLIILISFNLIFIYRLSSITLTSNCLGMKVVDDFDLIFEFGVGLNFDVQGENWEPWVVEALQTPVSEGSRCSRCRERHGASRSTWTVWFLLVFRFSITTTREDWNLVMRQGPDQRRWSFRFCWRRRGLGQYNHTSWSTWNGEPRTNLSK